MAMSVNRRIGRNLLLAMGHRDPESMIRARSTDPIRASGLVPRRKAGHMTAIDPPQQSAKKSLRPGGHPHMARTASTGPSPKRAPWHPSRQSDDQALFGPLTNVTSRNPDHTSRRQTSAESVADCGISLAAPAPNTISFAFSRRHSFNRRCSVRNCPSGNAPGWSA